MQVWIAGQLAFRDDNTCEQWQLIGVFDSRDKAIAACKKSLHFIATMMLNEIGPEEATEFPGLEFPHGNPIPLDELIEETKPCG